MKQLRVVIGIKKLFGPSQPLKLHNYHPNRPRGFGLRKTNVAYARSLNLAKNS